MDETEGMTDIRSSNSDNPKYLASFKTRTAASLGGKDSVLGESKMCGRHFGNTAIYQNA